MEVDTISLIVSLNKLTNPELIGLCKKYNVKGYSAKTKEKLVNLILSNVCISSLISEIKLIEKKEQIIIPLVQIVEQIPKSVEEKKEITEEKKEIIKEIVVEEKRKPPTDTIKQVCYTKFISTLPENIQFFNVKCPICRVCDINPFICEYGHIIPFSAGGKATPENLIPICKTCNRGMSNKNMNDYIRENYGRELPEIWKKIN